VAKRDRRSKNAPEKPERVGYDPDASKGERLEPLAASATFAALLQMGANIDLVMGRDSYEVWREAKGFGKRRHRDP
jgi:hypothetical protein